MNEIFNAALKYHDLGFNLTYINPKKNDPLKKKIYKAPTNNRQKLKKKKQEFPAANNLSSTIISIPLWPEMNNSILDRIINEIKNFFDENIK